MTLLPVLLLVLACPRVHACVHVLRVHQMRDMKSKVIYGI